MAKSTAEIIKENDKVKEANNDVIASILGPRPEDTSDKDIVIKASEIKDGRVVGRKFTNEDRKRSKEAISALVNGALAMEKAREEAKKQGDTLAKFTVDKETITATLPNNKDKVSLDISDYINK